MLKKFVSSLRPSSRIYLVNVRADEATEYMKHCKKTCRVSLEQIKHIPKSSIVIIEDIISLSRKEELVLRSLLNYYCHHKSLKLFAVSHTIHKNSIFSLLPLFHYLIFTSSAGNLPVVRFVLSYFKIDPAQSLLWLSKFESKQRATVKYLVFDCSKMSFYECPDIQNDASYVEVK